MAQTDKAGRKRYLESERRELLRKFGASGMTQAAFCRSNGLSDVTFSKWVRASGGKGRGRGAAVLAEVEVVPSAARELAVEVVRPDGKVIRFKNLRADMDHAAFIRRVASC
ncbi:MAG: transposase [Kiritimatiellae bacterium]|nr:transposase [Kiritimatiellia bacterium]MDD4025244.1 transposase [Kiritimatiellia bacterium]